jgi:hypothetical protein
MNRETISGNTAGQSEFFDIAAAVIITVRRQFDQSPATFIGKAVH